MLSFSVLEIVVLMLVFANATAPEISRVVKRVADEQYQEVDGIDIGCQTSVTNKYNTGIDKGTMTEDNLIDGVLPNGNMAADRVMKCSNRLERDAELSLCRTTCSRSCSVQQGHQHDLEHNQDMVAHHHDSDKDVGSGVCKHALCTTYNANERGDAVIHGVHNHSTLRTSDDIQSKTKVEMFFKQVKNMISYYMLWKEADDEETEKFINELIPDTASFEDAVDQEFEGPQVSFRESFVCFVQNFFTVFSSDENDEFMLDKNGEYYVSDTDDEDENDEFMPYENNPKP